MSNELLFEAIGTTWQIIINEDISVEKKQNILDSVLDYIQEFDKTYSRFRLDSLVHQMSLQEGTYTLPSNSKKLFLLYEDLYKITNGAFTPLVGQLLSDAGYDLHYSLKEKQLHKPISINDSFSFKYPKLTIKKRSLLDFGAAGKGYLVDLVSEIIEKHRISNFSINAGGDILQKNNKNELMRVGLENPVNTQQVIGVVNIQNQSICGSAGNRRKWGNFHHIINPHTLKSPDNILAIWAIADTALIADAMTTCLFFTKSAVLKKHYKFEYLILNSDFCVEKSDNFHAELFYK